MLRTGLFWLHLVAGVVAGAVILIMSVTGVLLTYEKQVTAWADTRQLAPVNAPLSSHLSADSLLSLARIAKPQGTPASITFKADETRPVQVSYGKAGVLYLNPVSGAILGEARNRSAASFGG